MALNAIQGLMGDGKSYVAVNRFMPDFFRRTKRPIYTNLPLEVDAFLAMLTPRPAEREEYRQRLHFLEDKEIEVPEEQWERDKHGQVVRKTRNQLREFWFFTEPNAVVFLDELADIYNSLKHNARPDTLQSYINHHRHYKDDLYFFCQDRDDVDVQIRRKIQYVWTVRNSVRENIFEFWLLKGIKWPMQFFMVKCYLGTHVLKLDARQMTTIPTQNSFWVFPSQKGFRAYRSFSAATTLPGKRTASEDAVSSDCDKSIWNRIRGWADKWIILVSMAAAVVVALFMFYRFVMGMLNFDASTIVPNAQAVSRDPGTNGVSDEVFGGLDPNGGKQVSGVHADPEKQVSTNAPPAEKLVLVANGRFVTETGGKRKTYEKGSRIGSNIVARVFIDGVHFEGGGGARWDVLFPGN